MGFFIGPSACSLYRFEQINGDKHFDYDCRHMSAVAVMAAIAGIAIPRHAYMPTCLQHELNKRKPLAQACITTRVTIITQKSGSRCSHYD